MATLITSQAFASLASRDFQVLRPFLSKTASETLLYVGANRVKTPDLLPGKLPSSKILGEYFGIVPKFIKELSSELINAIRF
jgi:hypothetical protein